MEIENANTVNDVQEEVGALQAEAVTEEVKETETEGAAEGEAQPETEKEEVAQPERRKQTPEENRRFAEARRALESRERELAEREAKISEQTARLNRVAAKIGAKSPDEAIAKALAVSVGRSVEEVRAELDAEEQQYAEAVNNSPVVLQAREMLARQQASIAAEKDLLDIQQNFPNETAKSINEIKNFEKVLAYRFGKTPDGRAFEKMSVVEAYKLANLDTLHAKKVKSDDKEHLQTFAGNSSKDEMRNIPREEYSTWKDAYPDLSEADLKKKYNNYRKRIGE